MVDEEACVEAEASHSPQRKDIEDYANSASQVGAKTKAPSCWKRLANSSAGNFARGKDAIGAREQETKEVSMG